ncbi:hypothetical protein M446_7039 (plasmid) [Methylobacterium sp. 4-46]|uniref:hypothetical protein n=1 Tax=unclassified Methylobacterium TaxID=2615210 RepID=UPI000152D3E6|nr:MULTISPECIES: hypothetical protein [Methylobacterium]ACA21257.1 hypothetical protein M446_7039 [Methylobacterium sp. 4-46]WFT83765.1 hypothetical protein QA634_35415 [Methylobacterium nodulans]
MQGKSLHERAASGKRDDEAAAKRAEEYLRQHFPGFSGWAPCDDPTGHISHGTPEMLAVFAIGCLEGLIAHADMAIRCLQRHDQPGMRAHIRSHIRAEREFERTGVEIIGMLFEPKMQAKAAIAGVAA